MKSANENAGLRHPMKRLRRAGFPACIRSAHSLEAADKPLSVSEWWLTKSDGDENAGLRRDAMRSQVIDALEAQEIKETGGRGSYLRPLWVQAAQPILGPFGADSDLRRGA